MMMKIKNLYLNNKLKGSLQLDIILVDYQENMMNITVIEQLKVLKNIFLKLLVFLM